MWCDMTRHHVHKHDQHYSHDPDHDHGPDHSHSHGVGHNHPHGDHLHSHIHGQGDKARAEELKILSASFVEGFRSAEDKTSYLRLSGIPFQQKGQDGLTLNLVDATIISNWQIGTASPAFGSRELAYLPFPGPMVEARETMNFVYVSLTERVDMDLLTLLNQRTDILEKGHTHDH
tara:strand:+ start:1727 stop:2251 length:525 start_codon:yes stop_codon:yes gene_type:complete